jgi:hypothetical protein
MELGIQNPLLYHSNPMLHHPGAYFFAGNDFPCPSSLKIE